MSFILDAVKYHAGEPKATRLTLRQSHLHQLIPLQSRISLLAVSPSKRYNNY
jgi:hypothetical protein